jgi:hypothetical protein
MNLNAATTTTWNGPSCANCGKGYLGVHQCAPADIMARIRHLMDLLADAASARPGRDLPDRTASCPCRPENGGSGVCGCILSGTKVTC